MEPAAAPDYSDFVPVGLRRIPKLRVRDVRIHSTDFEQTIDDNLILEAIPCRNYKIAGFCIQMNQPKYIIGVQFTYLNLDNGSLIKGNSLLQKKCYSSQEFTFEEDEYIIEVFGRAGAIIDQIGFKTTKRKKYVFGGQGGTQFRHKFPPGYHMGAVAVCRYNEVNGYQFDLKKIPEKGQQKRQKKLSQAGELFESAFGWIIEYLTCSEVMHLFLINKTISEYRKISERFWTKCLSLGDPCVLTYLSGLRKRYELESMDIFSKELYHWEELVVESDYNSYKLQIPQGKLQEGQTYVICFKALFQNIVYDMGNCQLHVYNHNDSYESITSKESISGISPVHAKKFAFFIKASESARNYLCNMEFHIRCVSHWDNLLHTKILDVSAGFIKCDKKDLREQNFTPMHQDILINFKNLLNIKASPM